MEAACNRVILDPSFLFTDEALGWIEDPELGQYLMVSEALVRRLEGLSDGEELAPYAEPELERVAAVLEAIERNAIEGFSYELARERGELPEAAVGICERLLANEEPLADVLADEWAFVTSQSLATISERARHTIDAFVRAGAEVVEATRAQIEEALELARNEIPPNFLERMKRAKDITESIPKWLVVGGHLGAHFFAPPLALPLILVDAIAAGNAVIAGDP